MNILVIDQRPERTTLLTDTLIQAHHDVIVRPLTPNRLSRWVEAFNPDAVILGVDRPTAVILAEVASTLDCFPVPMVMITENADRATIQQAVHSGVSAYVVDGLQPKRIDSLLTVACARFDAMHTMRDQNRRLRRTQDGRNTDQNDSNHAPRLELPSEGAPDNAPKCSGRRPFRSIVAPN